MPKILSAAILALLSLSEALVLPRADGTHTTCSVNRGNTAADADAGIRDIIQKVETSIAPLDVNDCYYTILNSTAVSICNKGVNGRNITVADVQSGFEMILSKCGSDGNYNGAHYTSDLNFKIYGVTGGPQFSAPATTSHGGDGLARREGSGKLPSEICPNFGFNGVSNYGCRKGDCPKIPEKLNQCNAYCEIRRTGFYGMEEEAPPPWGQVTLPGQKLSLTGGVETSTTYGVGIGLGFGEALTAITAAVDFSFSTTTTKTTSTTLEGEETSEYYSRWVFFPKIIESCGTFSRKEPRNEFACTLYDDCCEAGTLVVTHNLCHRAVWEVDGEAQVFWAQRFEYADGRAVPMHLQSASYRGLCNNSKNPDGDEELECSAEVQEPQKPAETPEPEKPQGGFWGIGESECMRPPTPGQFMNVVHGSSTECSQKMYICHNLSGACTLTEQCQQEYDTCLSQVTA